MPIKVKDELLVINILAILLILIITFLPLGVLHLILGLPVALFLPGYTLIAALFPRKGDLGTIERVALSFGLSVAVVAFIGFILNYTPWGIRLYPVLLSITLFIMATSVAALFRRRRLSPAERFGISLSFNPTKWAGTSGLDKVFSIALIVTILAALGTLGYAIGTKEVGERFTQFYILDVGGKTEGYPKELVVGEEGRVIVGIVNHEHEDMSYRVEVAVDGITNKEIGLVALAHQEKWEEEIGFIPAKLGDNQKVEFLLYKDGEDEPYHRLHLWVNVKQ